MHQLNVLVYGPHSFLTTLNELKPFLKFNHFTKVSNFEYDLILFHEEALKDKEKKDFILKSKSLKICISEKKNQSKKWDAEIQLPTTVKHINTLVENITVKKRFSKNS